MEVMLPDHSAVAVAVAGVKGLPVRSCPGRIRGVVAMNGMGGTFADARGLVASVQPVGRSVKMRRK